MRGPHWAWLSPWMRRTRRQEARRRVILAAAAEHQRREYERACQLRLATARLGWDEWPTQQHNRPLMTMAAEHRAERRPGIRW